MASQQKDDIWVLGDLIILNWNGMKKTYLSSDQVVPSPNDMMVSLKP